MRTLPALFVLALAVPAAHGQPSAQPRTEAGVVAAETAWVEALRHKDTAALTRLLTDDFVDTTWQGVRRDKASAVAALVANGPSPLELSDLQVVLHGDTGICRGLNTVHGPDGAVRARIRFTDVFLYRDGAWRAVSAQETVEQAAPNPR